MKSFAKRDSVWSGIIIGLMIPTLVYAVLYMLYALLDTMELLSDIGFAEDFRTRTLALVAICSNLIVMQVYRKSHWRHETIRGILIASMLLVGIWFWKFGFKLLQF